MHKFSTLRLSQTLLNGCHQRFQTLIFFPELWTEGEQANRGKIWVMTHIPHK